MLVYGDICEEAIVGEKSLAVQKRMAGLSDVPPGIERHAGLVAAFIELSELAQGIADAEFQENRIDRNSARERMAAEVLVAVASLIRRSWLSSFEQSFETRGIERLLTKLAAMAGGSHSIQCRAGEGYLHYAVYPECFIAAGASLPARAAIIGIRSIGLGLAAAAAASSPSQSIPVSLRPFGHPFCRKIALAAPFADRLLSHSDFAIVDEGPGLSGSSFGAVADYLEDHGVTPSRIHFLPSHAGDLGPMASPRHRLRWSAANRRVVDFDALASRSASPPNILDRWVADLTGPALTLEDISAGRWRAFRFADRQWPPAFPQQERRKFLLTSAGGAFLLKFAGLGVRGERKHRYGRALSEAGLSPKLEGYRHGFLVERWEQRGCSGLPPDYDRETLIRWLGGYLGFRAKHFAVGRGQGASLRELAEMARTNVHERLGVELPLRSSAWESRLAKLQRLSRPIAVDGRLHRWEWILRDDGSLLKTDAVDHHTGHDLIGCQDIAWDLAGAAVELSLSDAELDDLRARVMREGDVEVDCASVDFLRLCYAAFQIGLWTNAGAASDQIEADRIERHLPGYERAIWNGIGHLF